jgi:hypothetical protein
VLHYIAQAAYVRGHHRPSDEHGLDFHLIMTMRLRMPQVSVTCPPQRNNRHISCASGHMGHPGLVLLR